MEKERGLEAIQRLGSRGLYSTRLLQFNTRLMLTTVALNRKLLEKAELEDKFE